MSSSILCARERDLLPTAINEHSLNSTFVQLYLEIANPDARSIISQNFIHRRGGSQTKNCMIKRRTQQQELSQKPKMPGKKFYNLHITTIVSHRRHRVENVGGRTKTKHQRWKSKYPVTYKYKCLILFIKSGEPIALPQKRLKRENLLNPIR